MPRAAPIFTLPDEHRLYLESLLQQATLEQKVAKRCEVLLLLAKSWTLANIAQKLDLHRNGAIKIRQRYLDNQLNCLKDAPRSGKPPVHKPATKQKIIATVCGKPPKGQNRWSARRLSR